MKQQKVEHKPSQVITKQEHRFIKLGLISTQVTEIQWEHWKKKTNYIYSSKQQPLINQKCNQNMQIQTRSCYIENTNQSIYSSQYRLQISTSDGLQTNRLKSVKFQNYSNHSLQQLQDLNIIKLHDPVCMPVQQKKNIIFGLKELSPLYFYKVGVTVSINQNFLYTCNSHYQQKSQIKLKYLCQDKYLKIDQEDQMCFTKRIQYLINILKGISETNNFQQKNNQAVSYTKNNLSKSIQHKEDIKMNEPHSKQDLKKLLSNQKQENKVISYNFCLDNDPGQYFDITNCDIETKVYIPHFMGQLKNYQVKALNWMLYREGCIQNAELDEKCIDQPFWKNYGKQLKLYYGLFYNQRLKQIIYNKRPIKKCQGGILADQMGLGKTIMMIALILKNKPYIYNNKQTLIIAPLSLLANWQSELNKFAPHLNVMIYKSEKFNQIYQYDVVIISQCKMRSQRNKSLKYGDTTLADVQWFRIIIDEFHNFRNASTKMAEAVCFLKSRYRWCLSGTPKQNSSHDIYSFCKFLQVVPWGVKKIWQPTFPKKDSDLSNNHLIQLKQILKGIMLRRKKNSKDQEGNKLVELPKLDVNLHYVKMSKQARKIYNSLDITAKNRLELLQTIDNKRQQIGKKQGENAKQQKKFLFKQRKRCYNSILGLLIKMRMICCHAFLYNYTSNYVRHQNFMNDYFRFLGKKKIERYPKPNFFQLLIGDKKYREWTKKKTKDLGEVYGYFKTKLQKIQKGFKQKCGICNRSGQNMQITPCLHFFCDQCIKQQIANQKIQKQLKESLIYQDGVFSQAKKNVKLNDFEGICPVCKDEQLKLGELFPVPRINQFDICIDKYQSNHKIRQLQKYLKQMKYNQKAVVYTNFIGMIRLIQMSLKKIHLPCLTLQGKDNTQIRKSRLREFQQNPQIKALIITLKIGSVGLNLQCANKVFIMDPWWNPAIQEQAIARAHRFGQNKQVEAIKFVTEGSVQAKIIKDSHNKKRITDSLLDIDQIGNDKRYNATRPQIQYLLQAQEEAQFSDIDEQGQQEYLESLVEQIEAKKQNPVYSNIKIQMNIKGIKKQYNYQKDFSILSEQQQNQNQDQMEQFYSCQGCFDSL